MPRSASGPSPGSERQSPVHLQAGLWMPHAAGCAAPAAEVKAGASSSAGTSHQQRPQTRQLPFCQQIKNQRAARFLLCLSRTFLRPPIDTNPGRGQGQHLGLPTIRLQWAISFTNPQRHPVWSPPLRLEMGSATAAPWPLHLAGAQGRSTCTFAVRSPQQLSWKHIPQGKGMGITYTGTGSSRRGEGSAACVGSESQITLPKPAGQWGTCSPSFCFQLELGNDADVTFTLPGDTHAPRRALLCCPRAGSLCTSQKGRSDTRAAADQVQQILPSMKKVPQTAPGSPLCRTANRELCKPLQDGDHSQAHAASSKACQASAALEEQLQDPSFWLSITSHGHGYTRSSRFHHLPLQSPSFSTWLPLGLAGTGAACRKDPA